MAISGIESAKLKLDRASVHINAVKKSAGRYLESEPARVPRDADGKYTLNFRDLPPPEIAILAGEAIYQMRSALDHLAFDLVQLNSGKIQLPSNWVKNCQFPLLIDVPTKGNPPVPCGLPLTYGFFEKNLPGISMAAFAFIESMQPYYDREGSTQLLYLAKLSNVDKHRHLHVTKARADVRFDVVSDGFHTCTTTRTENGAEVKIPSSVSKGHKVKAGFTPFVSFDESGLGMDETGFTVCGLLDFCFDGIEHFIIPAFSEFLKRP